LQFAQANAQEEMKLMNKNKQYSILTISSVKTCTAHSRDH